ncbi:ICMT-domain-containing protein [Mycena crocata]|nr:ICMT-domain-containing protein [Mycena crocata]
MSSASALFKIFILPIVFIAHYYTTSPPNAAPSASDRVYSLTFFDVVTRVIGKVSQLFVLASLACEAFLAASTVYPDRISVGPELSNTLCPHPKADLTAISPEYLGALVVALAGSYGRIWCYKALGSLFTYEVTLRPSHKLISHGLYGWVRHPGYTSLFVHLAGMVLLHLAPGGWNHECGIMQTAYIWSVLAWLAVIIFSVFSLSRRGKVEDAILQAEFKEKWETYRSVVPYKFVPGII